MARKTVNVMEMLNQLNHILANDVNGPEFREGVILAVEAMLHTSGNYNGFSYLELHEVPHNQLPGINSNCADDERFTNTDSTRRYYFRGK